MICRDHFIAEVDCCFYSTYMHCLEGSYNDHLFRNDQSNYCLTGQVGADIVKTSYTK